MSMFIDTDGDLAIEDDTTAFEYEGDIYIDSGAFDKVLTFLLDKKGVFYDPALGFAIPSSGSMVLGVLTVDGPSVHWFDLRFDQCASAELEALRKAYLAAHPELRPKPEAGELWTFTTASRAGEVIGQIRQAQGDDLAIRPVDRPGDFLIEGQITKLVKRLRDKDGNWVGDK